MLTEEEQERIRHAYYLEHKAMRVIAQETGHSLRTVSKAVAGDSHPSYQLLAAQRDLHLSKLMTQVSKLDLIVLDEPGFIPFSKYGAQLLFQLCSELCERVSVINL